MLIPLSCLCGGMRGCFGTKSNNDYVKKNLTYLNNIKMKKLLLTTVLALATIVAMANPIDRTAAMQKAKDFMQGINPQAQLQAPATPRKAMGANNSPIYYIFNAENNQGFVIVSGDDRMEEVLGYSDTGSLDLDNLPVGLQDLLDLYVSDMKALDDAGLTEPMQQTSSGPRKAISSGRTAVAPLIETHWNQGNPFCDSIPRLDTGDHIGEYVSVGCSNVCIAQIMYYWKYAQLPSSGLPGYTSGNEQMKPRPALPYREFDFNKMAKMYKNVSTTTEQKREIAVFFKYLTTSTKTIFSYHHGSVSIGADAALRNSWGYTGTSIERSTAYPVEFNKLIYNDLAQGFPVFFSGKSEIGAGHTFVIDGYDKDDFFHINWGWEAYCDGYFKLTPFNANNYSTQTGNYSCTNARICIGIRPKNSTVAYTAAYDVDVASLGLRTLSFSDNANGGTDILYDNLSATKDENGKFSFSKQLRTRVSNYTGKQRTFATEITIYDNDLNKVGVIGAKDVTVSSQSMSTAYYDMSGLSLADGEYMFVPRAKDKNSSADYHFDYAKGTSYAYVKAVVSGNKMTLSLVPAFEITKTEYIGTKYVGYRTTIRYHVKNNSFDKLVNFYTLYKDKINQDSLQDVKECRIQARSTGILDMQFTVTSKTEQSQLLLVNKDAGNIVDHRENFTASSTAPSRNLGYSWSFDNASGSKIYGNKLGGTLKITNNSRTSAYQDVFTVYIYYGVTEYNGLTKSANIYKSLTIPARGSVTIKLDSLNYSDGLTSTGSVQIRLYDGRFNVKSSLSSLSSVNVTFEKNAILWWDQNGKLYARSATTNAYSVDSRAAAVSFVGLDNSLPSSITPNNNRNCIYYFSNTNAASKLTDSAGKNVVIGNNASQITFTDNATYGAYVPYTFKASSVSYTRTFTNAYNPTTNNESWSTICLPFNVQAVSCDGKTLSWYKNSNERNKDFWIEKFIGEEYRSLYFNFTDNILANEPYIIRFPSKYTGKAVTFTSENVDVLAGTSLRDADNYDFVGTQDVDKEYGKSIMDINTNGNSFDYANSVTYKGFRAYVASELNPTTYPNAGKAFIVAKKIEISEEEMDPVEHRYPLVRFTYSGTEYFMPAWDARFDAAEGQVRVKAKSEIVSGQEIPAEIVTRFVTYDKNKTDFCSFGGKPENAIVTYTTEDGVQHSMNAAELTYQDVFGKDKISDEDNTEVFCTTHLNYNNATYTIPESIVYNGAILKIDEIGTYAYMNYTKTLGSDKNNFNHIKNLVIPASITKINNQAFRNNVLTNTVTFDSNSTIEEIPFGAFMNIRYMKRIEIPASVKFIGSTAFGGCEELNKITFNSATSPKLGNKEDEYTPFEGIPSSSGTAYNLTPSKCAIYVPAKAVSTYRNAEPLWNEFILASPVSATKKYVSFCSDVPFTTRLFNGLSWEDGSIKMYWADKSKNASTTSLTISVTNDTENAPIPAGFGLVMKTSSEGGSGYIFMPPTTVVDKTDLVAENNLMKGITKDTQMGDIVNANKDKTYYILTDNKFIKVTSGVLPAGRAYLEMPNSLAGAKVITFEDDMTDGIILVDGDKQDTGNVYDIQGRKVENLSKAKGIYIKNGKKYIIK